MTAVAESGADAGPYTGRVFSAVWAEDAELRRRGNARRAAARDRARRATRCSRAAKSDAIGAIYTARAQEAVDANVIGSPCYVLDGEVFWGQDRLPLLDSALKSGRKAYRTDA